MTPKLYDLRAERFVNPLGLTEDQPSLSWKLTTGHQDAYRIVAGSRPGLSDLWDTGEVRGEPEAYVVYGGHMLNSRQRVYWSVTVWSGDHEVHSDEAHFELGLLSQSDWKAQWIEAPFAGTAKDMSPSPLMRKTFHVEHPIEHARLYITALGLYIAEINGHKVGDEILSPGWTDYRKRVCYQTFDVTSLLKEGHNAIGVKLGDGWYSGHVAWRERQYYGDRPRLLVRLEVTHRDGTVSSLVSEGSWKVSQGANLANDLLMGETYDARKELKGWSKAEFDDASWQPVVLTTAKTPALGGLSFPPIRIHHELKAKTLEKHGDAYIFDLGQNMVGHVRLKLHGQAGQTVRLRHAEVLNPDRTIYTENLRKAKAEDHYTFAGDGQVTWEPEFTFHGFRYVELTGCENPPLDAVTGIAYSSDLKLTGHFECSEPLLNQLWSNIVWGWRGNSLSVPTDCPQRDERLGWTGDAQVFSPTANFITDAHGFYNKFVQDLADAQYGDGQIPPTAPDPHIDDNEGGPAWADAFMIIPGEVYHTYADKRLLAKHYQQLRMWILAQKRTSQNGIRSFEGYTGFRGFGDWLNTDGGTPLEVIGTAYFARCSNIIRHIAEVLGKTEDAREYAEIHQTAVDGFRREFLTPEGVLKNPTQTACVLAIGFDLAPKEAHEAIGKQITDDIEKRHWHLSTGFVGTPVLMDVLTQLGRLDIAYRLLEQKTWPSWLYPVTRGATTIWERWDGWTEEKGYQDAGMNSFNHYAYGAIGAWLTSTVAGIKFSGSNRSLQLSPRPGGSLTSASAWYESLYGRIESAWTLKGGRFEWKVQVPANLVANAFLPPGATEIHVDGQPAEKLLNLAPGKYHVTARLG